jgi:diamine N-acetyltransferase
MKSPARYSETQVKKIKEEKKGYGTKAIELALDFIRSFPAGEAEYCWVTYDPENEVAM